MQLAFGAQIDFDAERIVDVQLQACDVQQRRARGHVDQQIEVAAVAAQTHGDGAKDTHIAGAAGCGEGQDVATPGGKGNRGTHAQILEGFAAPSAGSGAGGPVRWNPRGVARAVAALTAHTATRAQPADLPVEQPTKFDLILNFHTLRALDVTVSNVLLLRADKVIQ